VIYISFNTITFTIHFFCNVYLFFLNDTANHLVLWIQKQPPWLHLAHKIQ
jgi:hypothetical protein